MEFCLYYIESFVCIGLLFDSVEYCLNGLGVLIQDIRNELG